MRMLILRCWKALRALRVLEVEVLVIVLMSRERVGRSRARRRARRWADSVVEVKIRVPCVLEGL